MFPPSFLVKYHKGIDIFVIFNDEGGTYFLQVYLN